MGEQPPGGQAVHPTAGGFDAAAADYARARPGYPAAALEILGQRLGLGPGRRVLDLGAGTGMLTRELVARGAEVVALEPVAGMRAELRRALPDVDVVTATAEATGLPPASVDAVTAAQSFHWFDARAALAEVHRVLRPGGMLAVLFNRRELSCPVQAAVDTLLAPYRGDTPSWAHDRWVDELDRFAGPTGFDPPELVTVPHAQVLDGDGLVARVASVSFVAQLGTRDRADVLARVRSLFAELAADDRVTVHYLTELRLLARRGA